jgi:hypothetical protein
MGELVQSIATIAARIDRRAARHALAERVMQNSFCGFVMGRRIVGGRLFLWPGRRAT